MSAKAWAEAFDKALFRPGHGLMLSIPSLSNLDWQRYFVDPPVDVSYGMCEPRQGGAGQHKDTDSRLSQANCEVYE